MPIPLRDVLADPTLAAADPLLLAGEAGLSSLVRWVHTSEIFEIADLLRGGELLLIGGISIATAGTAERHAYVRALAARGIAGLGIQTDRRLPAVPPEMVDEAARVGLPLIELRTVVPFVGITEAINGLLVNEAVRRLQLADRVSHALAATLAAGGDPDQLLEVLEAETHAPTELISLSGEPIARSQSDREPASSATVTAPVTTAGVTVATLVFYPNAASDPLMLDAARDRAPEALALALLRSRPLSHLERDARDFINIVKKGTGRQERLTQLARRLGIAEHGSYVAVAARLDDYQVRLAGVEEALRRSRRIVISHLREESYVAVVALGNGSPTRCRAQVVADLRAVSRPRGLRIVVGPGSRSLNGLERSLREATACFDLVHDDHADGLVDAVDLSAERLLVNLDRTEAINDFIQEQLSELLELDGRKQGALVETLSTLMRHTGNKTETARALYLQRQGLYQRLAKISEVLGDIPPGSARAGSLMIAVELEMARRPTTDS